MLLYRRLRLVVVFSNSFLCCCFANDDDDDAFGTKTLSGREVIEVVDPRRPFLLVSSFEFAQKRALTKDADASLSCCCCCCLRWWWWSRRYSYAQKKYNPNGTKPKKIGAKKKKMLALKSGMRRPE